MEITRPSVDTPFAVHSWTERVRGDFGRTSRTLRVVGAVGWAGIVLRLVLGA
jgi:hypothetical protein